MRFQKPKVVEKPIEYKEFLQLIERNELEMAMERTLRALTPIERVKAITNYMQASKFAAYIIAMRNFRSVISRYEEFKDKNQLKIYLDSLSQDYTSEGSDVFTQARRLLIEDLVIDDPKATKQAIMIVEDYLDRVPENEPMNTELKIITIELAQVKWPEAKNFKVLHGTK